jgi:phosphonate transport system substrate-binding protein
MAENTESVCCAIAEYIQLKLDIPTEYVSGIPWQERESLFDCGEIQLLWLCGLPYVHKADLAESSMELLAVPVPAGVRYQAKPVYFSDVVVRGDSPVRRFADLRRATWAYNEPRSHSGYNVVRAYLAELGESDNFFGAVVETGAHANSLQMILTGAVGGAAIDSTVLEWLGSQRAGLADEIRVIDTLGPSPIPPWVISRRVTEFQRHELRQLLCDMHLDPDGREILARGRLRRFGTAQDRDYDPIREMACKAERVSFGFH